MNTDYCITLCVNVIFEGWVCGLMSGKCSNVTEYISGDGPNKLNKTKHPIIRTKVLLRHLYMKG